MSSRMARPVNGSVSTSPPACEEPFSVASAFSSAARPSRDEVRSLCSMETTAAFSTGDRNGSTMRTASGYGSRAMKSFGEDRRSDIAAMRGSEPFGKRVNISSHCVAMNPMVLWRRAYAHSDSALPERYQHEGITSKPICSYRASQSSRPWPAKCPREPSGETSTL